MAVWSATKKQFGTIRRPASIWAFLERRRTLMLTPKRSISSKRKSIDESPDQGPEQQQ
jgi:hypothetical protein